MRGKTEKLNKVIEKLLLSKGITKNIQFNKINTILRSNISVKEMESIRIGYLKKGILYIFVNSSSLLYEINCFKKESIFSAIKKRELFDIKKIKFLLVDKNDKR